MFPFLTTAVRWRATLRRGPNTDAGDRVRPDQKTNANYFHARLNNWIPDGDFRTDWTREPHPDRVIAYDKDLRGVVYGADQAITREEGLRLDTSRLLSTPSAKM
jgi:hypothetical protein